MVDPIPVVLTPADVEQLKADIRKQLLLELNPPTNMPPAQPPVQETWWQQMRPLLTPSLIALQMIIVLGGAYGVSRGWWTKEDVQTVQHIVVDQQTGETTTVTTTGPSESKPKPQQNKPNIIVKNVDGSVVDITKPKDVTPVKVGDSTPPQWITELNAFINSPVGQQIIQKLFPPTPPANVPPIDKPPTNTPPANVPPANVPPVDHTGSLKLSVFDVNGLAVPSSSVPAGRLLMIKLEGFKGPKIEWTKRPTGDVQFLDNGNQTAAVVIGSNSELDLFVTDYGQQQQVSLRIVSNLGGQPPPVVNPPVVVTPPVNPPVVAPPQSKQFTLYIVESGDPKNVRTLTTASILNNLAQRNNLNDRGHSVVTKTDRDNDPSVAYVKSQGTPLPALAIYDNAAKQFVQSVQLPIDMGMSLILPMGG